MIKRLFIISMELPDLIQRLAVTIMQMVYTTTCINASYLVSLYSLSFCTADISFRYGMLECMNFYKRKHCQIFSPRKLKRSPIFKLTSQGWICKSWILLYSFSSFNRLKNWFSASSPPPFYLSKNAVVEPWFRFSMGLIMFTAARSFLSQNQKPDQFHLMLGKPQLKYFLKPHFQHMTRLVA